MTAIIGVVMSATQSMVKPVDAPATEYVEIPEGSSSAAPVISPGPRVAKKRLTGPADLVWDNFVTLHLPISNVYDAMGVKRDIVFVRYEHDSVALIVQVLKKRHDLVAGSGIE